MANRLCKKFSDLMKITKTINKIKEEYEVNLPTTLEDLVRFLDCNEGLIIEILTKSLIDKYGKEIIRLRDKVGFTINATKSHIYHRTPCNLYLTTQQRKNQAQIQAELPKLTENQLKRFMKLFNKGIK